jgi:hypothetical protein
LVEASCHLPGEGWGRRLIFADASPAAGRDFTDDGRVHEARGLKGRPRQAAARRATRNVPIPRIATSAALREQRALRPTNELAFEKRENDRRSGAGRIFRGPRGRTLAPDGFR